ncbi:MAG: hypothetical protein ACK6CU_13475 [Deltaproteobacteria bacterium]|jgi:hypothetical protein
MNARPEARPIPVGPGLVAVRLAMAPADVVVLGGVLSGYDGIASLHGEDGDGLVLLTTESMWPSLAPLLEELDREIAMQRAPATHGY